MSVGCGGDPKPTVSSTPLQGFARLIVYAWLAFSCPHLTDTRAVRTKSSHGQCDENGCVAGDFPGGPCICGSPLNSFLPLEPLGGGPSGQHLGWALGIGGLAPNHDSTNPGPAKKRV